MQRPEAATFSGQCGTRSQKDTAQRCPRKQVCPVPWNGGPELPTEVLSIVYFLSRPGHPVQRGSQPYCALLPHSPGKWTNGPTQAHSPGLFPQKIKELAGCQACLSHHQCRDSFLSAGTGTAAVARGAGHPCGSPRLSPSQIFTLPSSCLATP